MKQTPAHNIVNIDLMNLIPPKARNIVEVGCMHGAMARSYREINPSVHYVGMPARPELGDHGRVGRQQLIDQRFQ